MSETASVNIPKDMIEPVIKAHIQTAIVSALGDGRALIEAAVQRILNEKVDEQGKPSTYSNARPFVDFLMRQCITTAAKEVIMEELPKHKEAIRASIKANLARRNSPLIRQFVDGMVGALTSPDRLRYRVQVDFNE